MSGVTSDPKMVGQDSGTQQMVQEAMERPEPTLDEAVQAQANEGPGREAVRGEGGGATGIMGSMKEAAASAVDTLKQANPATRDLKEKHC